MNINSNHENELRAELKDKRKEFSILRSQLNSFHQEKEQEFQKLRSIHVKAKSYTDQIDALKAQRDQLIDEVKVLKKERDTFNSLTKEKMGHKNEVNKQKKELLNKLETTQNPAELKSLIAKLDHQLETEVMPFPQEEKMRKRVKELQVQYKKLKDLDEIWKNSHLASADASEVRGKAERAHQKVQDTADTSQQKHSQINELYVALKSLREQEAPIAKKYIELKNQYLQTKNKLEEITARVKELSEMFNEVEEKSFREQIREKTTQIKEKIKKKQKLNMDDILAFQALDEN